MTIAEAVTVWDANEIHLLLTKVTGWSRATLYAYPERVLFADQTTALLALVQRRAAGEPMAYILGYQYFWSLKLKVTPDTLIPRPETECMVEWILQHYESEPSQHLLDLGTGSGAIALALARERPLWQIAATDISQAALNIARENADLHAVQHVQFYHGDGYEAVPPVQKSGPYTIIVSNPPYIREKDPHLAALCYEPRSALVAGKNGLADLEWVIRQGVTYLSPEGRIVLEHGYDQASAVLELLRCSGYADVMSHVDLAGHARFATGIKREHTS